MAFANYSQDAKADLAVSFATLILGDAGLEVSADNINALIKAAGVEGVKPYMGMLFAKILAGRNLDDMLLKPGMGGGAPAAAPAAGGSAPAAGGAAKKEEKKEEKKVEEEEVDMGGAGGLFGGGDDDW